VAITAQALIKVRTIETRRSVPGICIRRSVPLTDGVGGVDNSISDSRKDGTHPSRLYYVSTPPPRPSATSGRH